MPCKQFSSLVDFVRRTTVTCCADGERAQNLHDLQAHAVAVV
jgi:hypothetical protein